MRRRGRWAWLAAFAVVVMIFAAVFLLPRPHAAELPIFGEVPPFHLIERSGRELDGSSLEGKIWIAGFIFTHCQGPCPMLSTQMQRVQQALGSDDRFRLVTLTVDPERDTPAVLRAYARRYGAGAHWLFLTGPRNELNRLILSGFRLASVPGVNGDFIHSDKLVLVDGRGEIRGYYDGLDQGAVDRLIGDARSLAGSAPFLTR